MVILAKQIEKLNAFNDYSLVFKILKGYISHFGSMEVFFLLKHFFDASIKPNPFESWIIQELKKPNE